MKNGCYKKFDNSSNLPGTYPTRCGILSQDTMPSQYEINSNTPPVEFTRPEEICQIRPFDENPDNRFGGDNYCNIVKRSNTDQITYCDFPVVNKRGAVNERVNLCQDKNDCSIRDTRSYVDLLQLSAQANYPGCKAFNVDNCGELY